MTTYERLVSELGDGLGIELSPGTAGVVDVFAEGRVVTLRPDETGEGEVTVFTIVATAPEGGFAAGTLARALKMNLFGREVAGHNLGLFGDALVLSAALPIADLPVEGLADRVVAVARLAGVLSNSLSSAEPSEPNAAAEELSLGGGFMAV